MEDKQIVRDGYNRVSFAYRKEDGYPSDYAEWVNDIAAVTPIGSEVLDIGCGCGIPTSQLLSLNFKVTGIDISEIQIDRARHLIPAAEFICGDVVDMKFAPETFSAIVAFYSLIHIPIGEQPDLIKKIGSWIKADGHFMATVAMNSDEYTEKDWLGVQGANMFWSHAELSTTRKWINDAGISIVYEKYIPEGNHGHQLIFGKKRRHDV
jgi:2-polyprenyl-3-methyl-5-hydroxy-6-metoxy-1,4-benzoquinol methylase